VYFPKTLKPSAPDFEFLIKSAEGKVLQRAPVFDEKEKEKTLIIFNIEDSKEI